MKKLLCGLICCICVVSAGCSNEFAYEEYDSDEKIIQSGDRYAKSMSNTKTSVDTLTFSAGKFDGRETLWYGDISDDCLREFSFSLSIESGQAKLVHIDEQDNITTIVECGSDNILEDSVTRTIRFNEGDNCFKIVGCGCEDVELEIEFIDYSDNKKR